MKRPSILVPVFLLLISFFSFLSTSCSDSCSKLDCPGACFDGVCYCDAESLCRGELCDECPEIIEFLPENIEGLYPTLIAGDPYMRDSVFQDVSLELETIGQSIVAKVIVHFLEMGRDSTEAFEEWVIPIYSLGPEFELVGIDSEPLSGCLSIDYSPDTYICAGNENRPVKRFHIIGLPLQSNQPSFGAAKTEGYAHVNVVFNPIRLKVYRL